jgi:MFS transporter, DHA1 family, multidrug resistance protein
MLLISMIMALTALGVDLLLPAFDDIRASFDLAEDSTGPALLITVYFLGLAGAQLVWGPLADRFGRRPILYSALTVYCFGAFGAAISPTFAVLLASRLVWGIGAAGTRVVAVAIIRDRYEGDQMAAYMSRIMGIFLLVPIAAPLLGAGLLVVAPWRWLFWVSLVLAVALGVWALPVSESLDPANQLPLRWRTVGRAFRRVATTRITLAYTLTTVFMQGAFSSYLASSELVIDTVFDRGNQFPVIFAVVAALLGITTFGAGRVVTIIGGRKLISRGLVISIVLSSTLAAVALATSGSPDFWVFFPLLTLQLSVHVGLMPTLNSLALVPLGDIAGTATSVTGAVRVAAGAVIGASIDRLVSGTVTPWALMFLAGSVASFIAVRLIIDAE